MSNTFILETEHIQVGMIVTVHSWETPTDHSFCGEPFQVLGMQLPYIVVQALKPEAIVKHPMTWDTRQCRLMELSPKYVSALLGYLPEQEGDDR